MAMAGRPSKLTPEVQAKIVEAIRGGNYREVAAEWAGIGERTFQTWMAGQKPAHLEFQRAVIEAERAAEIRAVALIMKAAANDPKHAEWWLERKFHDRWGRKDKVDLAGKVRHGSLPDQPVRVEVKAPVDVNRIVEIAGILASIGVLPVPNSPPD